MKKAQGLSMNTIVIAAIALLVLVVLAFIFMGRMGNTSENLGACQNRGGTCRVDACLSGESPFPPAQAACDEKPGIAEGEGVCCLPV